MMEPRTKVRREEDRRSDEDVRLLAIEVRALTERVVSHGARLDQHMSEENEVLHTFMSKVLERLDRIEMKVVRR